MKLNCISLNSEQIFLIVLGYVPPSVKSKIRLMFFEYRIILKGDMVWSWIIHFNNFLERQNGKFPLDSNFTEPGYSALKLLSYLR